MTNFISHKAKKNPPGNTAKEEEKEASPSSTSKAKGMKPRILFP